MPLDSKMCRYMGWYHMYMIYIYIYILYIYICMHTCVSMYVYIHMQCYTMISMYAYIYIYILGSWILRVCSYRGKQESSSRRPSEPSLPEISHQSLGKGSQMFPIRRPNKAQ